MQLRIVETLVACTLRELGNPSGFHADSNWRVGDKVSVNFSYLPFLRHIFSFS